MRRAVCGAACAVALALAIAPALADPIEEAIQLTYDPGTRPEGILRLRELAETAPDPSPVRLALARALAWEGRHAEALVEYDRLLAAGEATGELVLERLEILTWQGDLVAAEEGYRELLRERPGHPEALAGLARVLRWGGRPLAALGAARAAAAAEPSAAAGEELAQAYLDLDMPAAARRSLPEGDTVPDALHARLRRASFPDLAVSTAVASDSFGTASVSSRAVARTFLPGDVRVAAGGGLTHARTDAGDLTYRMAGLSAEAIFARLSVGSTVAVYHDGRDTLSAGGGFVRLRDDRFRVGVAARRQPFIETGWPLATDEEAFHGAGARGAFDLEEVRRRGVDEARLNAAANPTRWAFAYGSAAAFRVTDENRGYSVAAGAGVDLLLGRGGRLDLLLRWDSYFTGFEAERAGYFSPAFLDVHSAGAEIAVRLGDSVELRSAGGVSVRAGGDDGGTGGGPGPVPTPPGGPAASTSSVGGYGRIGLTVRASRLSGALRVELRDDVAYRAARAWAALTIDL